MASSAAADSEAANAYPLQYVESLRDTRTKLEPFNILLRLAVLVFLMPSHLNRL
jgi:hypothetical protein